MCEGSGRPRACRAFSFPLAERDVVLLGLSPAFFLPVSRNSDCAEDTETSNQPPAAITRLGHIAKYAVR